MINRFKHLLSFAKKIDINEFTGHYDQLYLITVYYDNNSQYSFLFRKEYTDNENPQWIKINDVYYDNSRYLDIGQLELMYEPYKDYKSVFNKSHYIALYRCQNLILFLNKYVKSKADEEPNKLYRVIE